MDKQETNKAGKKPYEKPKVIYETIIQTLAGITCTMPSGSCSIGQ